MPQYSNTQKHASKIEFLLLSNMKLLYDDFSSIARFENGRVLWPIAYQLPIVCEQTTWAASPSQAGANCTDDIIQEQLKILKGEVSPKATHYLRWAVVLRDKSTTKVRVVYDASAKVQILHLSMVVSWKAQSWGITDSLALYSAFHQAHTS